MTMDRRSRPRSVHSLPLKWELRFEVATRHCLLQRIQCQGVDNSSLIQRYVTIQLDENCYPGIPEVRWGEEGLSPGQLSGVTSDMFFSPLPVSDVQEFYLTANSGSQNSQSGEVLNLNELPQDNQTSPIVQLRTDHKS